MSGTDIAAREPYQMGTIPHILIIGAGIAGLSTAAALAHAGFPVSVLEAHVYPGGCAATFRYQGHWFDAGATLTAGFLPGGPMQLLGRAAGVSTWPVRPLEPAMVVHLLDGPMVPRWGDERRWDVYGSLFPQSLPFWQWQEATASQLWDFALRLPELHPRSLWSLRELLGTVGQWILQARPSPRLLADLLRPVVYRLPADATFRRFIDAQLLIAAQATSHEIYALYAAAALDLPNRGVVEVAGGVGGIARTLVSTIERHGGTVLLRHEVTSIRRRGKTWEVTTNRGLTLTGDELVAALTPWGLGQIWYDAPSSFRARLTTPPKGWGAFVLYLSLENATVPTDIALHHQVVASGPLGEGRSIFLSLSPEWDSTRAPVGRRAATMSTHTQYAQWWKLAHQSREGYHEAVARMIEQMVVTASAALPWLRQAIRFVLPGTPLAFARFTRRPYGWVGGFPQRHPFVGWPTEIGAHLWLVGDSVFPGQSIPASALAGLRVARAIARLYRADLHLSADEPSLAVEPGVMRSTTQRK